MKNNYERCPKCNSKWNKGEIKLQACVNCGYSYAEELRGKETGSGLAWLISVIVMFIVGVSLTFLLIKQGMPNFRARGVGMLVWFVGTGILKNRIHRIQRWVKK